MKVTSRNGFCRKTDYAWYLPRAVLVFTTVLCTLWCPPDAWTGGGLVSSPSNSGMDIVKGRSSQVVKTQAFKDVPPLDAADIARQNNIFALDLYARLRTGGGNLFFSPYSITGTLAMLYAGSGGRTMNEMATVLHAPGNREAYGRSFSGLKGEIRASGTEGVRLENADSLWMQQGLDYRLEFPETLKKLYGAEFFEVNFMRNPDRARRKINTWVEGRTNRMVKDLLREGTVRPDTRLVLADAVYFSGPWASAFEPGATSRQPFHVNMQKSVPAAMMHQTGRFRTAVASGVSIIELPYRNNKLSMIVIMPDGRQGLHGLERRLSSKVLDEWMRMLYRARLSEVELALPRFALTDDFDLSETLMALGMKGAFSSNADFSGITMKKDLFLSLVVHKARIEVKEEGTVAAAATAAVMTKAIRNPLRFLADRPFLFMIRHNATGQILFMGRLADPAA